MARPQRNNADYFPHLARLRNGKRVKALRNIWKNDGYAFYCIFLEILTAEDFHQWRQTEVSMELLAAEVGVSGAETNLMMEYCIKLGLFYRENDIVRCPELVEFLGPLYAKRVRNGTNLGVSAPETIQVCTTSGVSGVQNTQSKVKESKVNISKDIYTAPPKSKKSKFTLELSDVGVRLNPRLASAKVCEAFYAFYEMRLNKPRKMPMTPRAAELVFMKLDKLAGSDDSLAIALLEFATVKGYDTVYEIPKDYRGQSSGQHNRQQAVSDAYQLEEDKLKNKTIKNEN